MTTEPLVRIHPHSGDLYRAVTMADLSIGQDQIVMFTFYQPIEACPMPSLFGLRIRIEALEPVGDDFRVHYLCLRAWDQQHCDQLASVITHPAVGKAFDCRLLSHYWLLLPKGQG